MSTMVTEIYDALKIAGVPEDKAQEAAKAVGSVEHVATKADLKELELRIVKTIYQVNGLFAGLIVLIMTMLKLF